MPVHATDHDLLDSVFTARLHRKTNTVSHVVHQLLQVFIIPYSFFLFEVPHASSIQCAHVCAAPVLHVNTFSLGHVCRFHQVLGCTLIPAAAFLRKAAGSGHRTETTADMYTRSRRVALITAALGPKTYMHEYVFPS
jgi:hypothetical protein